MSIVVDTPQQSGEPITETQAPEVTETVEAVAETPEVTPEVQEPEATTPELTVPEKYAGKSLEEVIEMHQNVEKALSRQGQELGSQRKLIQDLMSEQTQASQVETTEPAEQPTSFEDQFYEDPAKAVTSIIENHPEIKKAAEANMKATQQANMAKVEAAHPDFMDVVQDEKFQQWVGDSEIRKDLFRTANNNYDFNAANELLSTWKQLSMIAKTEEVKQEQKKSREKAMKQTTSESSSANASVGGKKVYRRVDLINLQTTDPTRYAQMGDEITQAYAEGRVK